MGNEVVKFTFESILVRVTMVDGAPWFVARDVCQALDILNVSDALCRLDDDEKGIVSIYTLGGKQDLNCISESGVYSFVLGSKKPEAKKFKRWVVREVLPSIRKTGMYAIGGRQLPGNYPEALRQLADEVEKNMMLESKIEEDKPKVEVFNVLIDAKGSCLIREFAKKYNLGPRFLYDWLKQEKVIFYTGKGSLVPYAEFVKAGFFILRETVRPDNSQTDDTSYLTHKGEIWLIRKLRKAGYPVQPNLFPQLGPKADQ